ncbi:MULTISPECIES: TonB-dependent receptor [Methylotenera]|uniref:TonB-dependent receptor n=1 Tax=Methylotenera TaxID=359407 RepID=UPI00036D6B24|nr:MULTISPECIES: TonB-dependent siderophore receptor [Methylotenera]
MNKFRILWLAVMAATLPYTSVFAEEDALLGEVVVTEKNQSKGALKLTDTNKTGSRLGLTALETPASIESIDISTIRLRGDNNVREAVSRSTGITDISNLGTGVAFSARGFTGNNSVGQAEDGIRLQTAASTLTYPSDTWGYQQFDILRGPASVLFGDGTVGGIINSIRKAPSRESQFEALVGVGTLGVYRTGIGGSGALGEAGAYRVDASVTGGNGYVNHGDYDSAKLMTGILLNVNEDLRINFTADVANENPTRYTGIPLRNGRIDESLRNQNYNVRDSKQHFEDTRLRAKLDWDISDTTKLSNISYWSKADRHWRNVEYFAIDDASNTVDRFGYTEIKHKQKQLGDRLELASTADLFGHHNRWAVGYEISRVDFSYYDNFYDGNDPSTNVPIKNFPRGYFTTIDPTVKDFASTTQQQAFFAENALDITEKIKFITGLRQDWIDVDHESRLGRANLDADYAPFSYRVGAVFQPTKSSSLYGQFSRESDPVSSIVSIRPSSGAFKLTSAQQAEVGVKHVLADGKGELTFALYHIAKDNIITRDPSNSTLRVQGGKQSSRGVELAASLFPIQHWRTDLNVALLDARYDKLTEGGGVNRAGNTPIDVPEKTANLWLYYQQPDWEAGIGARLVGRRYADNANTSIMRGYTIYDANVAWNVNPKTTLRASLRNLTDKVYAPVSYDTEQFILGESRRVELTAELKY